LIVIIGSRRQQRSTRNAHDGTGGLGSFSTDAERGTVADLLYARVAQEPVLTAATWDSARWAGVWSSNLTTWPNHCLHTCISRDAEIDV